MNVDYSRRAIADLDEIATHYLAAAADVAARFEARFRAIVAFIGDNPTAGLRVAGRDSVRVVFLVSFPYKVFYRIVEPDRIRILHVRHTSRRSWSGG